MGFMKKIAKPLLGIGAAVAAPFTGGTSLAWLPAVMGAGGAALGYLGGKKAAGGGGTGNDFQYTPFQYGPQMDQSIAQLQDWTGNMFGKSTDAFNMMTTSYYPVQELSRSVLEGNINKGSAFDRMMQPAYHQFNTQAMGQQRAAAAQAGDRNQLARMNQQIARDSYAGKMGAMNTMYGQLVPQAMTAMTSIGNNLGSLSGQLSGQALQAQGGLFDTLLRGQLQQRATDINKYYADIQNKQADRDWYGKVGGGIFDTLDRFGVFGKIGDWLKRRGKASTSSSPFDYPFEGINN